MKILFWDTETNGLPKDKKEKDMRRVNNWPRVIELAWQGLDLTTGELFANHSFLIKPDGWKVPTEKFWIDNGFSQAKSMAEGAPMASVLGLFVFHLKACDVMVAHNIDFDYPITGAELIRHKMEVGRRVPQMCTMKATTDILKLPAKFGGYKWPNLTELHKYLFGTSFDGAHGAGSDVDALRVCFMELLKRGLIKLPSHNPLKSV